MQPLTCKVTPVLQKDGALLQKTQEIPKIQQKHTESGIGVSETHENHSTKRCQHKSSCCFPRLPKTAQNHGYFIQNSFKIRSQLLETIEINQNCAKPWQNFRSQFVQNSFTIPWGPWSLSVTNLVKSCTPGCFKPVFMLISSPQSLIRLSPAACCTTAALCWQKHKVHRCSCCKIAVPLLSECQPLFPHPKPKLSAITPLSHHSLQLLHALPHTNTQAQLLHALPHANS